MNFEDIYELDIYANKAGIILEELNSEHAKMSLKIEKRHLNAGKVAHGGAIFLLADTTMAAIANYNLLGSVSIQSDIRFLSTAIEGDVITAMAVEVFGRKKFHNCRVTITNQNDDIIAIGEGMFYTKSNFKVDDSQLSPKN